MTKDTCRDCRKRVNSNERGIQCDDCKQWCHAECQGVNVGQYEVIVQAEESSSWVCRECKGKCERMEQENYILKCKLEKI